MKRLLLPVLLYFLAMISAVSAAENIPMHALHISFDPEKRLLLGQSEITLPSDMAREINLKGLMVGSVTALNGPTSFSHDGDTIKVFPGRTANMLTIVFQASYTSVQKRGKEDGIETGNIIGPEGIALLSSWYPALDGPSVFRLTAILPSGFEAISEADEINIRELADGLKEFRFIYDHPSGGINFIAGRYIVTQEKQGDVSLLAYFFPEDRELGRTYLEYAKKYLKLYEDLIGPFPFKRFSVVENILPTGFSMPTYTLLGRDVVRLPFITETSLGHEILHQWFGNAVPADYGGGNWAEGLTTYLADHLYEDKKGRGWEYRKQAIISYLGSINEENDFALKDFSSRTDRATAAVGYGKASMVFHMLRQMLGDDLFFRALREFFISYKFRPASWADLQKAFEAASGQKLDLFFEQWIKGRGVIDFDTENALVKFEGSGARVSFTVKQQGGPFTFRLPVMLRTDKGGISRSFVIEKETTSLEIETADMPVELVLDSNYDLFRRLYDEETAPVIATLLGDRNRIFVVPKGMEKEYAEVSGILKEEGFAEKKEEDLTYDEIKKSSLLLVGGTSAAKLLFAKTAMPDGDFSIVMKQNPYNRQSVVGIINSSSLDALKGYIRKITHYGKYGTLSFKDGRNTVKSVSKSDQGIRIELSADIAGVEIPGITTASRIIEKISSRDIVYVGEHHDRFDHHRVQLQVIRELYKKNKKLAIGMEMFQKPFQNVLDDYIAGKINEREFLRKSEYFKRWVFDYNLYREILLFARENRIPVIALNIRKEIVSKVSKDGIQSLKDEDLKELPGQLDLSDSQYRERLREFFAKHANFESRNFDFFYQSQVLWDESMANNLNEFMQKDPGYQVVVLAGAGHMQFGSGIPKRSHRLNSRDYAVILNSDDVEKGIADFVLYPTELAFTESPKLGIVLKEENDRVTISGFGPGSIAEEAGIKIDDIILSADGEKIGTVEDLKIHLFYKKKGDSIVLKVQRKRFLLSDKEMEISVTL